MGEIDRRITAPYFNEPFLRWYEGTFESVYIALHPFLKIDGIDPLTNPRTLYLNRSDIPADVLSLEGIDRISAEYRSSATMELDKFEEAEKLRGQVVRWHEVRNACGFESIAQINLALLTIILALRPELGNLEYAHRIQAYCEQQRICLPTGDRIPAVLEVTTEIFIEKMGYGSVIFSDEFNRETVKRSLVDLRTKLPWNLLKVLNSRACKVFPEDFSFLMISPFDSFYTAICGRRGALEIANVEGMFEGFWCDKETRPDWWQQ